MFSLTEASTRRRAVAVRGPIAASAGSILAGQSVILMGIIGNNSARQFRPDPTRPKHRPPRTRRAQNLAHFITHRLPSPDIRNGDNRRAPRCGRRGRQKMHDARLIAMAGRADEVTHADADETRDSRRTDPRRASHQR